MIAILGLLAFVARKDWKLKKKTDFYEEQIKLQSDRQKKEELYRKELMAQIQAIRREMEESKLTKDSILGLADFSAKPMSGITIVDTLLSYKKACGQRNQIPVELAMSKLPNLPFSDTEYVGLFGNLLDNAMEAASKTENPWVKLESFARGGQWLLKVTNSKPAMDKPLECAMATTKGSGHGLGTKIISKIVKRHKGAVEYKDLGETFEAMVVFSAAEGSEEGA